MYNKSHDKRDPPSKTYILHLVARLNTSAMRREHVITTLANCSPPFASRPYPFPLEGIHIQKKALATRARARLSFSSRYRRNARHVNAIIIFASLVRAQIEGRYEISPQQRRRKAGARARSPYRETSRALSVPFALFFRRANWLLFEREKVISRPCSQRKNSNESNRALRIYIYMTRLLF